MNTKLVLAAAAIAAITVAAAAPGAHAATMYEGAYPAAKDPSGCAIPFYSDAIVQTCTTTPRLFWSLPMSATGKTHVVSVTSSGTYFAASFSCGVWPVGPTGTLNYPTTITFTKKAQTLSAIMPSNVVAAFVTCDIPVGDGVATLSWAE